MLAAMVECSTTESARRWRRKSNIVGQIANQVGDAQRSGGPARAARQAVIGELVVVAGLRDPDVTGRDDAGVAVQRAGGDADRLGAPASPRTGSSRTRRRTHGARARPSQGCRSSAGRRLGRAPGARRAPPSSPPHDRPSAGTRRSGRTGRRAAARATRRRPPRTDSGPCGARRQSQGSPSVMPGRRRRRVRRRRSRPARRRAARRSARCWWRRPCAGCRRRPTC